MKQILPDLWETETESPAPGLTTHAYLLTTDQGNVLFYNTGSRDEIDRFAELGGVARHYLSHEDELGESLIYIARRYSSHLVGHRNELEAYREFRLPDIVLDGPVRHLGFIDVIPVPGHSPGSTCYFVHSPTTGKRYLFTGDALFRGESGRWTAGLIPGVHGRKEGMEMYTSLLALQSLEPDLVLSSAFAGGAGYEEMSPGVWPRVVGQAREALLENIARL